MQQRYNTPNRRFREPLPSYGLIMFHKTQNDEIYVLIQQRRDTFAYIELLQGLWNIDERISILFTLMSDAERERVRTYSFDELWNDMWIFKTNRMYTDKYTKAKRKFEVVKNNIEYYIETTQSIVEYPPWGFPKGRKDSIEEAEIECAIRETEEETRIPREEYSILEGYSYSERFQGSNSMYYSTLYFLCETNSLYIPEVIETPECIRKTTISDEVNDLKWAPYEEACKYLEQRRKSLLLVAMQDIEKYYTKNK